MKKYLMISLIGFLNVFKLFAQPSDFEVKEWPATGADKPCIFYLTGDGGLNSFSTNLCTSLNRQGYQVIALNSKKYFWDKKTALQTATDIENCIIKKNSLRKNKSVLMIGYSFGADVLPFAVNRFSKNILLTGVVLMAPSGSTDFEIHLSDMFGGNKKRDMDVAAEINKINIPKLVLITGEDEDNMDDGKIKIKNFVHEKLPGGHHFDGNTDGLIKLIMKYAN